ncbi:MAG TPA: S8 family serine peptidase [Gemmatimonadales bacterium]|nr:S8 family serine peptidase [Gemmatimonadales bacterium]
MADYLRRRPQVSRVHVLVQFRTIPTLNDRQFLLDSGQVRVLDPIPERAFFTAIPATLEAAVRLVAGPNARARWVGAIETTDKIAPWYLRDGIPPWARHEKSRGEFIVQFFGDVQTPVQQRVLSVHQAEVLARVEAVNGWQVLLDSAAVMPLASEDQVKWIVPVPPPTQDDNDGVRSATGVNADAVLAPTAYNLSGNGITVAQWEGTNASQLHGDFAGRITLADPPIPLMDRTFAHDESVAANGQFDNGEAIYQDLDDSQTATTGDTRITAVGGFAAGSVVAAGDADVGTAIVVFIANDPFTATVGERWADDVTADFMYAAGESIYRDNDISSNVTVGDTRLTPVGAFAAGSVVAAGDADLGTGTSAFPIKPHYHATHVAGTVMGSGAQSAANGGTANQWKGVAPGASLRSYDTTNRYAEYTDAAANNTAISTNSWGTSHCNQQLPPNTCYNFESELYDGTISGRRSDGTASGLARRISIFGSAGNNGYPDRHAENVTANGIYDNGESIYSDYDDNGVVSAGDLLRLGAAQPNGTLLVNFAQNEKHDESVNQFGRYENGEGIYLDADASATVTVGDTRVIAVDGFAAGSVVAAGNADVGTFLRQFRFWGNTRIPNSAKNTMEVANISSDANTPSASTSRGPTDDGRVKPDISGPGSQNGGDQSVWSTWPGNTYSGLTGTSMSTPALSGSAAVLSEWYGLACNAAGPTPDAVKALLIHAAEDLATIPFVTGTFSGPDFAYGYGRARLKEAVDLIPHHVQGALGALGSNDITVTIGAMDTLKVTLVWNDPAWTANAAPAAATGILQNDLDLELIAPNGTRYTPWILNPAAPAAPATRALFPMGFAIPGTARDRLNPVEQVQVDNAMAGDWVIRVTASTLNLPAQSYTLVSEVLPPQSSPCTGLTPADVWMRDNPSDVGTVPSSGSMWLGPDLWNRLIADGMTGHENPEYGQPNYLYANIRNLSATTVRATNIEIWAGAAALGLQWPEDFTYVGRFQVPNLNPMEIRQIGPLIWDPPSPTPSDHFCLYMRVMSTQDPITFTEVVSVWTNAQNSNNIAYRNINVVDLLSSKTVTFLTRNIERRDSVVDIHFRIPPEFLEVGEVFLRLSPELEKAWQADRSAIPGMAPVPEKYLVQVVDAAQRAREHELEGKTERKQEEQLTPIYRLRAPEVVLRNVPLAWRQAEPIRLTFNSDRREQATYRVEVVQHQREIEVGGIVYLVRTGRGTEQ